MFPFLTYPSEDFVVTFGLLKLFVKFVLVLFNIESNMRCVSGRTNCSGAVISAGDAIVEAVFSAVGALAIERSMGLIPAAISLALSRSSLPRKPCLRKALTALSIAYWNCSPL